MKSYKKQTKNNKYIPMMAKTKDQESYSL